MNQPISIGNKGKANKATIAIARWRLELLSLKFSFCDIVKFPTRLNDTRLLKRAHFNEYFEQKEVFIDLYQL